jgi:hypothetical protein
LVNVNITDLVVQAPIAIAANTCDVTVAVLAPDFEGMASPCDATATTEAIRPAAGSLPVGDVTDAVGSVTSVASLVPTLRIHSVPVTVPEWPVTALGD